MALYNTYLIYVFVLLPFVMGQSTASYSSLETETLTGSMTAALRNTLVLPLKQIQDTLEPLERMRDDLASIASWSTPHATQQLQPYEYTRGSFLPSDCGQLYRAGYHESGVYNVFIYSAGQPVAVPVFCDMETDGGGWLVTQRRKDGSVDFYKNWFKYSKGFGNITGEFWLGNELLHILTDQATHELRVDLQDHEGEIAYAKYAEFYVGPRRSQYTLSISGYSGNAGDSLSGHNNAKFSTKDQDNDSNGGGNCAISYRGAWWYTACHSSNLNGVYAETGSHNMTSYADHVTWKAWRGYRYSIKFSEMKIRPLTF